MRKLLIGAALCALFAAPGFAAEPVKLSSAQMDKVTAAGFILIKDVNANVAVVNQTNVNWSKYSWVSQTNVAYVEQKIDD